VELVQGLTVSVEGFESLLDQVSDVALALETPCAKWSVEELIWHVARGSDMTVLLVNGGSQDEAKELMRTTVKPPVILECRRALRAQLASLSAADLDATAHHPVGDVTVRQLFDFRIMDVTLHSWDLARAIGADEQLPGELVEHTYGVLAPMEPFNAQIGIFGDGPSGSFDADADASAQAKLLDLSGRRP
jgi:uncharacterized protein (TIGR03086 family)